MFALNINTYNENHSFLNFFLFSALYLQEKHLDIYICLKYKRKKRNLYIKRFLLNSFSFSCFVSTTTTTKNQKNFLPILTKQKN